MLERETATASDVRTLGSEQNFSGENRATAAPPSLMR